MVLGCSQHSYRCSVLTVRVSPCLAQVLGDTGSSLTGPAGRIFYLLERAMETKKILADLQAREETLQLKLRDEVRCGCFRECSGCFKESSGRSRWFYER